MGEASKASGAVIWCYMEKQVVVYLNEAFDSIHHLATPCLASPL